MHLYMGNENISASTNIKIASLLPAFCPLYDSIRYYFANNIVNHPLPDDASWQPPY